jgi:hypothetical protein
MPRPKTKSKLTLSLPEVTVTERYGSARYGTVTVTLENRKFQCKNRKKCLKFI